MGAVHGALRLGLPSGMGFGIVGVDADDMDVLGITELGAGGIGKLTTENEVKALCHPILLRFGFRRETNRALRGNQADSFKFTSRWSSGLIAICDRGKFIINDMLI